MLAPQFVQWVAPAGTLLPQLRQVVPIAPEPVGELAPMLLIPPIDMEPIGFGLIDWPGNDPGTMDGLNVSPRMAPMSPRRKPMKKPPREEVAKLTSEKTRISALHIV